MSEQTQRTLRKYLITSAIAGAACLLIMSLHGLFQATELVDQFRILADAFTVPGVVLIMIGVLVWVSTEGMFDGLGYAFHQARAMLIPSFKVYKHTTYYDYKMEKSGKRAHGYSFLFFTGLGFLLVGIVFVVLHEIVYVPSV